jgi:HD superfamily phosphodiesterase
LLQEIRETLIGQETAYQHKSAEEEFASLWTHSSRVGRIAHHIAKAEGWDAEPCLLAGLLHDIDFEKHPAEHPGISLGWFREWGYPDDLIHAVEAHAYGYNGFNTLPRTPLAAALLATDLEPNSQVLAVRHLVARHKLNAD